MIRLLSPLLHFQFAVNATDLPLYPKLRHTTTASDKEKFRVQMLPHIPLCLTSMRPSDVFFPPTSRRVSASKKHILVLSIKMDASFLEINEVVSFVQNNSSSRHIHILKILIIFL